MSAAFRHESGRRTGPLAWLVLLCALLALPAHAQTVYVIDQLEIGVHRETDVDSVILAVIPTGTELQVLERDGEFVRVTTPDGVTGWVDARYVVDEKPGGAALAQREAEFAQATRDLGAARAQVEVLRQQLVEVQAELDQQKAQQENVAQASDQSSEKLRKALSDLQDLADENQRMQGEIARLESARTAAANELAAAREQMNRENEKEAVRVDEPRSSGRFASSAPWSLWQWLLFASILLLAFAAGGYLVDWETRRRHGGFRI